MPSRRHSSAMLCSPRKPSSTTRIFSSAEYCFRVARRMSFTTCSDDTLVVSDFCLICASPWSYDEPEILPCSTRPICLTSADGEQYLSGERAGPLSAPPAAQCATERRHPAALSCDRGEHPSPPSVRHPPDHPRAKHLRRASELERVSG